MRGFLMAVILFAGVVIMNLPDDVLALPLRLLGFLICWCTFALGGWLYYRRRKAANDRLPVTSVRARVIGRRTDMVGPAKTRRKAYYLKFQPEEGETLEFEVSGIEYGRFDDGDSGRLDYRGWEYLGMRRYDLGDMTPVTRTTTGADDAAERAAADAPVSKADGMPDHEREE